MTDRQKKKLAMYEAVMEACDRRRFEWQNLPAFAAACQDFAGRVKILRDLAVRQTRHTGGVAQTKRQARERLCHLAHEIGAATRACALAGKHAETANQIDFSLTDLRMGKDALCLQRCRRILAAASAQLAALEDYGITKSKLAELNEALEEFTAILHKPREIRTANKKITARLPAEFQAADDILYGRLDNLMPQFRERAPRFFADFTESRVMKGTPSMTIQETSSEEAPMLD